MFFGGLFKFTGHSIREPASSKVTSFIVCGRNSGRNNVAENTGASVSHSQHRKKNRERFWKNADECTGRVEISKEEIPGSKRSMYSYILTYLRL